MAIKLLATVLLGFVLSCGGNDPSPPSDAGVRSFSPPLPDLVLVPAVTEADSH